MDFSSWTYYLILVNVRLNDIWFGLSDIQVYGLLWNMDFMYMLDLWECDEMDVINGL